MTAPVPVAAPTGAHAVFLNTAWTAASQLAVMGLGAGTGVVLLLRFGKGTQTDAAFAAYGVYGLLLVITVGFRITVAPRLAEGPSQFANFDRFVGASASLLLVTGVVLVVLGGWVAAVLGGQLGLEAQATIRVSLAILWIALLAQLLGALAAALLGVHGEFALPGFAYMLGALIALACLLMLPIGFGVIALPVSTAVGSVLMSAMMLARLVRIGYVPHLDRLWNGVGQFPTIVLLMLASVSPVAWQLNYLISLGFASRLGVGAITLYTYSFAAAGIIVGVTASAAGLVLAGQLAQTWDRRPESLDAYMRPVLRAGLLITVPALAVAGWIGADLIVLLLGRSLNHADAQTIVLAFLGLSGMMIGTLALQIPSLAALALSQYGRIAFLLLVACGFHFGISVLAFVTGEVALLGVATSISTFFALLLVLAAVYGKHAGLPLLLLVRELGQIAAVSAIAFVPLRLVSAALGDGLWDVPLIVLSGCLFGVLVRTWLPDHYDLGSRIARQVLGPAQRRSTPRAMEI
jgi:peptidoglycan biosynthesis protein MviN/MurJ (putative lipid II flippase)